MFFKEITRFGIINQHKGEALCNHFKRDNFFKLISYDFCIVAQILKVGKKIFVICNCSSSYEKFLNLIDIQNCMWS